MPQSSLVLQFLARVVASSNAWQLVCGAQYGPGAPSTEDAVTVFVNGCTAGLDPVAQPEPRLYTQTVSPGNPTHFMFAPHSVSAAQ
jgi:hypothetical protein